MAEKLICAVTIKLSEDDHHDGCAVAQMDGMCLAEFMRDLLQVELARRREKYRALDAIFGSRASKGEGNQE